MPPIPLLFLTDSPDQSTGLARIGRELANRVHSSPALRDMYRVGFLGRGGIGGDFLFPNYTIPHNLYGTGGSAEWGASVLEDVWVNFAGSKTEPGIVFTIWDAARMLWLSCPQYLAEEGTAKKFLMSRPFKLWGYFPIDGHTPAGGLGRMAKESMQGYDRVLAYTRFGAIVAEKILGCPRVQHIYHGMSRVWSPRDWEQSRKQMGWQPDQFCVGVVAANQLRKDWGLAAEVGKLLLERFGLKYQQWWHVDVMENPRAWSINSLLDEFGLGPHTVLSARQDDEWMAAAYSACDVTLAIGSEGFGFPIVESQMCGAPVVHGRYAGGAELVPPSNLVPASYGYRLEGPTNVMRPIYSAKHWADAAETVAKTRVLGDLEGLRWENLWPQWEKWFADGYPGVTGMTGVAGEDNYDRD